MLNRSNTARARTSTRRVCNDATVRRRPRQPWCSRACSPGYAAAGFAATLTWQAGGGVLLSLLAYSLTGSVTLVAAALAIAAIAAAPQARLAAYPSPPERSGDGFPPLTARHRNG